MSVFRFIPETSRTQNNKVATRSLVSDNIHWEEWKESLTPNPKPKEKENKEENGPVAG